MTTGGRHWYTALYVQVLIAVVLGALVGWLFPAFATNDWVEFLGRGFVKLVKMAIAPLIFCTVVSGIAHIQEASSVGRVGLKALIYFEAVSTLALVVGLTVGSVWHPGASFPDITLTPEQAAQAKCYADAARQIGRSTSSCTCLRPEDIPALGGGLRRVRGAMELKAGLSTAERWPTHALRSIREIGPCDGPRHNDGLSGLRMGNVGYPRLGSFQAPQPRLRVGADTDEAGHAFQ